LPEEHINFILINEEGHLQILLIDDEGTLDSNLKLAVIVSTASYFSDDEDTEAITVIWIEAGEIVIGTRFNFDQDLSHIGGIPLSEALEYAYMHEDFR